MWIPVTVKAMGGIVTVLVHKYAGSVLKGFALVLGLVLSGMYEHDRLSPNQILGTVLVLISSWMHFTSPLYSNFRKKIPLVLCSTSFDRHVSVIAYTRMRTEISCIA